MKNGHPFGLYLAFYILQLRTQYLVGPQKILLTERKGILGVQVIGRITSISPSHILNRHDESLVVSGH